jgi:hypothetical protein
LREWNEANPEPEIDMGEIDRALNDLAQPQQPQLDPRLAAAMKQADKLMGVANQAAEIAAQRVDAADFKDLLSEAKQAVPDASEETLARLLVGAYHADERVAALWEGRHKNETAFRNAFDGIISEIQRDLTPRYDERPIMGATMAFFVSVALSGTRHGKAPEAPPPRYGDMSDAEFSRELEKLGIESRFF